MISNHFASVKTSWLSTIAALASFLRSPRLVEPSLATARSKVATTLWLFVMSIMVTAAFAFAGLPFVLTSETSLAGGLSNVLDQPVVTAIVAVLVLGPVIEEIMFRGWLTGTWRALIGTVAVLAVFYMGPRVTKNVMDAPFLALQFGFLAFGLTIFWALASRRTSSPINGFERLFPLMFWGQGAVFGMLHFRNLYSDTIILPLLMSLPLVVCGWLWGYARVAIGLPAALVLHMAYNVPSAVGMVVFIAMAT